MVRAALSGRPGMGAQMSNLTRLAKYQKKTTGLDPGTNDLLWSETFTNAVWVSWRSSIIDESGTVAAPYGAAHLFDDWGMNNWWTNDQHWMRQTGLPNEGSKIRWVVVKQTGSTPRHIQISGANNITGFANFDLASGTVGNTGIATTAGINDLGDGWFQCWADFNDYGGSYLHLIQNPVTDTGWPTYVADHVAGNGVYIAAAQREALGVLAPMGYAMTTDAAV